MRVLKREFINTEMFDKCWKALNLSDLDLRGLQNLLLEEPLVGDVIPGAGGARKLRIAASDHGKRGGARVIYVDIPEKTKTYFLLAYPKNVKENITANEKKAIVALIAILKGDA